MSCGRLGLSGAGESLRTSQYYYLGLNHYQRHRAAEAEHYVHMALTYLPDSAEVNMLAGLLDWEAGRSAEAETCFIRVLQENPHSADAHFYLACLFHQQRRQAEAEQAYLDAGEAFQNELAAADQAMAAVQEVEIDPATRQALLSRKLRQREELLRESRQRLETGIRAAITPVVRSKLRHMGTVLDNMTLGGNNR